MEDFAFFSLQIHVLDKWNQPVPAAYVKAYHSDWMLRCPYLDGTWNFARTDATGNCNLYLPRGRWTVVVGGGTRFNYWHSGKGLFLFSDVSVESTTSLELKPNKSFVLRFYDRSNTLADVDRILAAPSVMVPNCLMPEIGMTNGGVCSVDTNASAEISYFFVRRPTTQYEGYCVFTNAVTPGVDLYVRTSTLPLKHIHFDGRNPDGSPGAIQWVFCFPNEDMYRYWWHTDFWLEGQGDVYLSPDFVSWYPRTRQWDQGIQDNWFVDFHYSGIDLLTSRSLVLRAGARPYSRSLHFLAHPPDENLTEVLLGPVRDAYGNEVRTYWPENGQTPRISHPFSVWDQPGGTIIYNSPFVVGGDNLGFRIPRSFPSSSWFRLDWNLGPYDGLKVYQGSVYDPAYTYDYDNIPTAHFQIHAPKWSHGKNMALATRLEEAYSIMVELIGKEPPITSEENFYINPTGLGAGWGGQALFYHGYVWWHPKDPGTPGTVNWEAAAYHEIGHRMESELFRMQPSPFPLEGGKNEAVAEMISHYTTARVHGEQFAVIHWSERAQRFFSYLENPSNPPCPKWQNIFSLSRSTCRSVLAGSSTRIFSKRGYARV